MIVKIAKTFDFDCAHFLPNLPDGHKCKRMHGHTYRVEVECTGPVDERGFVVDYQEIADAWAPLHELLDHNLLNDIDGLENPSTEIIAPWILARMSMSLPVTRVRVYESSTTWCEVSTASAPRAVMTETERRENSGEFGAE